MMHLESGTSAPLRILCIGAHSDDIEIGCGGLILSLLSLRKAVDIDWVVFSAPPPRAREARRSAELFLRGARRKRIVLKSFRDGFFPFDGAAIKRVFEGLKSSKPDLVLTHHRDDRHQDHRVLSDLAWNTFRDHWILEYEIPKYDGGLTDPNMFVPLDAETRARKVDFLLRAFGSQRSKRWFTRETFDAVMRLRGIECASATGYAEGFCARKVILSLSRVVSETRR